MARAARSYRASVPAVLSLLLAAALLVAACSSAPRQPKEVVAKKNRAAEYTDYGNRAFTQGDNRAALTFFQQALAINLSVDNESGVVQSLSSIGKVHVALGELDQAEEVFARASRLATTLGNPPLQVQTAINLGEVLLERDQSAAARELLSASLVHAKALAGTRDLAVLYHALAVAEKKKLGELDAAQGHLELAMEINRKLKAPEETASNLYQMASIYSKREQYAQALEYALQALQTDKDVENSLGIAQDLLALGIISSKLARDIEAFDYLERSYGIYGALSYTPGLRSVLPQLVETGRRIGRATEADAYAAQLEALDRQ